MTFLLTKNVLPLVKLWKQSSTVINDTEALYTVHKYSQSKKPEDQQGQSLVLDKQAAENNQMSTQRYPNTQSWSTSFAKTVKSLQVPQSIRS